ncbi:MAG: hypothetical protein IH797_06790, partial [Chloroflexi bacterium]|nr:hypothetical protein [Chloroflexota bacterium]
MSSQARRLSDAQQSAAHIGEADPMMWVKPKLLRFAQGALGWDEAVDLIGDAQLEEWRQ